MNYDNETVRRQDRLLDEISARELLKNSPYGVLSMQGEENDAYGLPISYAWDGEQNIYLHCAAEGKKLRLIDRCNRVSFCVIGQTKVIPDQFTTEYESIILNCTVFRHLPEDERLNAFELILDKYSPQDKEVGMAYARKAFEKTEIIRLQIGQWSGKCKRIK